MLNKGEIKIIANFKKNFNPLNNEIGNFLLESGFSHQVLTNIHNFPNHKLDIDLANRMILNNNALEMVENIDKYIGNELNLEMADRIISFKQAYVVGRNLKKFEAPK